VPPPPDSPALVSAHVPGDETTKIGNYRGTTVNEVHVHTVYDAPVAARGVLRWDLLHLDGRRLEGGRRSVALRPGESRRHVTVPVAAAMATHGRDHLYLRIALDVADRTVSEETVFLAPPRFLALPRGRIRTRARAVGRGGREVDVTFQSAVFQHRVHFDLPGVVHEASDNFFELYPNEPRTVRVSLARPLTPKAVLARLRTGSLVDTYA